MNGARALRTPCDFAPLFEMAARMTPDPDMPDHMQDDDILTAARARRKLVAIEEEKTRVARIERTLKGEAAPEPALLSLVAVWEKARPQRNAKSAEKSRLYVTRFVEVVGDIDPQAVRRSHVVQFRDALEARGYTTANTTQHLAKLQTLFKTAVSEGVMSHNPAEGVKARRQARDTIAEDDKGFTAEHMQRIFAALDGETPDFQWIIRLLAYHGARSGEICQLKCGDVAKLSGVDVIRIHGKNGSVKNRQSVRAIPVHPKCKAIIAHAAKGAPDEWLFPSLTDTGQGRGHNFQKYANGKFLRDKVGITDRTPVAASTPNRSILQARFLDRVPRSGDAGRGQVRADGARAGQRRRRQVWLGGVAQGAGEVDREGRSPEVRLLTVSRVQCQEGSFEAAGPEAAAGASALHSTSTPEVGY